MKLSTQIIEEGPPVAASPDVWDAMEKAAVALAKAVGYANAGTVEYLYSEPDQKFYFLELNPRLQVEHPVTEMITRVNLPAAQLQVAMGIPLCHIPDIRELYGQNRFEGAEAKIDFAETERKGNRDVHVEARPGVRALHVEARRVDRHDGQNMIAKFLTGIAHDLDGDGFVRLRRLDGGFSSSNQLLLRLALCF